MRTRSQARRRRQPQVRQTSVESSNLEKPDNPPLVTDEPDHRPMAANCSKHPPRLQTGLLNKITKETWRPGRFLILCEFTGITTCNALADLGASINLKPYSVWNNLSLPELTPTCITLELADRSITKPIGIADDVFVMWKIPIPDDFLLPPLQ
ncbi:reverse transcriptase domain-containing protein [Tanacetum coccineum]